MDPAQQTDSEEFERLLAIGEAQLRAKVQEARLRAKAVAEAEAIAETERLIALCEAPALLWQHDVAPERTCEPFGMIA